MRTASRPIPDRTVHGVFTDARGTRTEVVRYNRIGKWFLEPASGRRSQVPVKKAVSVLVNAMQHPGARAVHYRGRYGGGQFDAKVYRERGAQRR